MTNENATHAFAAKAEIPQPLREEFNELAFRVAHGDASAEGELVKVEQRIADAERLQRRREAAELEQQRRQIEADALAEEQRSKADERAHAKAVKARTAAYLRVQQLTDKIVVAVRSAIAAGGEARASALRLDFSPGALPSSEISSYLFWRLGRDGMDCAGLDDCPPIFPQLRKPLVVKE
jgi:hypothetical protein